MPKIVRTSDNDYRIITAESGQIILDTTDGKSNGTGKVVVRGDLEVFGGTTTIESVITTIQDSIIVLAAGNTSSGLPGTGLDRPFSSGIEIDRGLFPNARWVYDDSISWGNWGIGTGAWIGTQGNIGAETVLPVYTVAVVAPDDLYLIPGASGALSVSGTNNYEERVFRYENSQITPDPNTRRIVLDDDYIPNAKGVKDLVDFQVSNTSIDKIVEDNTSVEVKDKSNVILAISEVGSRTVVETFNSHGFATGDQVTIANITTSPTDLIIEGINGTHNVTEVTSSTTFEIDVNTTGGDPNTYTQNSGSTVVNTDDESVVEVTVEGSNVANFYNNRVNLSDIEIRGTNIFTSSSNDDLTISAPGTGVVRIDDTLEITRTPGDDDGTINPLGPLNGVKIYAKSQSSGKTGIYFVNEDENRDELISKNRSLLYSIIF